MLWASFDSIAAPFPPALARALSKQIDVSGIESVRKADWNRYYPVPQLRQSEVLLSLWGEASAYICVSKICDGFPVFDSENQYLIALRELLKYTMQDQYDYIGWWLYEAPDAGYTVWWDDEDGKEIRVDLTEPGALYDYLVEYAAPEGVQEDEL